MKLIEFVALDLLIRCPFGGEEVFGRYLGFCERCNGFTSEEEEGCV
jgi:hypothetical protein